MSDDDSDFDMEKELETLQKTLIQKAQIQKNKVTHVIDDIHNSIREYLRNVKIPYRVVGGMAVNMWLNPEHKGLTLKEKEFVTTNDWDIEVLGGNDLAKSLTRNLLKYLTERYGKKASFISVLNDTMVMPFLKGFYVYRIGIEDGAHTTEWIVDIHGQSEENFKLKDIVLFEGIKYQNLKSLLSDIEIAIEENPGSKGVKRFTRKDLLYQALKDISRFNPKVLNILCDQCENNETEQITGYNIDCETIKKLCPKKAGHNLKDFEEYRRKRLQQLIS